jgi:hypothetical protein
MRVKKYNLYNITSLYVIQVSDSQGIFIDYNMLFPYQLMTFDFKNGIE